MNSADLIAIFGGNASTVESVLAQYDADVMIRPVGAGKSLANAFLSGAELRPHVRRLLVMLDALPDMMATLERETRKDGRVIYYLKRTYALDPTVAWDGREFVATRGVDIEDWLRGDVDTL